MAVKVVVKPDSRYLQERSGAFRPIENLSITASTPAYPAVLHKTRRTMILADDHTHAVIALDKEMLVSRNADLSVVLIAYTEPTEATWKALELHMESERSTAEVARAAQGRAQLERKRVTAAEIQEVMLVGRRALVGLTIASALTGCASPPPPPAPPPKPVVVGPPTDTVKIPLTDLLARTYYGNAGGIYPGGINQPPADHDSVARARRNLIKPLDVNGDESPFGKYVLLSIGMSNATQEWCSQNSGPPCAPWSFMGKAVIDPTINHYSLVVVNGAADGQDAPAWTSPTSQSYDRIKFGRLAPLGLSENQVQVAWVKLDDQKPSISLPANSADANILLTNLG